jgi:tetratricopeptide (TPR) repeat protein
VKLAEGHRRLAAAWLLGAASVISGCASTTAKSPRTADGTYSANWSFAQGEAAAARGDTVRAEQYFALAEERGYDSHKVLARLLSVCLKSSRLRAALNHAEPYLQDHPEDHDLRYLVASIYAGLGEPEKARSELERLLRDDPEHADGQFLLATLEIDGEPASARAHFREYLALAPHGDHAADVRGRLRELALEEDEIRPAKAQSARAHGASREPTR